MVLKINNKAPDFSLPDKDGLQHSLNNIKTKYVVVYFYPKDNTPGCTIEANSFNSHLEEFKKFDTTVIGISGGDEKSKTTFCAKHSLKFALLTDANGAVGKSFGSYGLKKFMGREYEGFMRNTFVLDQNHTVIKIFEKVKPPIHVAQVLDFIQSQ
jgi:thioredoxin-dependent peroxiredoxin